MPNYTKAPTKSPGLCTLSAVWATLQVAFFIRGRDGGYRVTLIYNFLQSHIRRATRPLRHFFLYRARRGSIPAASTNKNGHPSGGFFVCGGGMGTPLVALGQVSRHSHLRSIGTDQERPCIARGPIGSSIPAASIKCQGPPYCRLCHLWRRDEKPRNANTVLCSAH